MAEKVAEDKLYHDSKKLAIVIYDFLLEERCKKNQSKKAKRNLDRAANCLEKVYGIRFTDYVLLKLMHPLQDIFAVGCHPVPVKNKLAAISHKQQGNNFMSSEMYKLAEVEYTRAVQLDPRNAIYYCNRAASKIRQGLLADAVPDCNKALELDRNYAKAYTWLGLAHALMDNPARAVRCFRKALRIEPDNSACIANMDLISRKLNSTTFRIFEPLYRYSRNLIRIATNMTNNQKPFRRKHEENVDGKTPHKAANLQIQKYNLGELD